ncbi:hypothetical protein R1sor_014949 [Riccia sorocarpa]|uniref:DEK-C domain-containing protein n=1 Tax=Riccia sorocarpa TaxID=122646 RepID=A0ABD3HEP1_9MARC
MSCFSTGLDTSSSPAAKERRRPSEPSMKSTVDAQSAGDAGTDVEETKGRDGVKLEKVTGEEEKMAMEIDAGSSEAEISKPAEGTSVGMDIDPKDEQKREEVGNNEEEQKAGVVVNPKKKGGRPSREKVEAEKADEHVETDSGPADEGKETKKRGRKKRAELPIIPLSERDRPARERKSIDRFVAASLDKEKKEVVIKQGKGTPLMDIPNVAYKLGKRGKGDELLGMLHSLLFNQRGKANAHKYNIYRFSGFVWGENEEKEKNRVKEKLEKYTKEGLGQLIDILDLHLPKTGKKEELVVKVLQFLESPHKTTEVSLGEKEQKLKEKKRKGRGPGRGKGSSTAGRKRRKVEDSTTPKRGRGRKTKEESESEGGPTTEASSGEEDLEVEEVEGARLTYKESEEDDDDDDDEDYQTKKKLQRKSSKSAKTEAKEVQGKASQDDESEQGLKKSTSDFSLAVKTPSPDTDRNASKPPEKVYTKRSRKKNKEKEKEALEKEKEKEKTKQDAPERKRRGKDKDKTKEKNSERTGRVRETTKKKFTGEIPSDEVLQNEIRNLLKDLNRADFSKVTFMDIVLQLQDKLNVDLSVEKAHVKLLIRQEVSRLAGEGTDEDAPSEADAPPEGEDEAHADETATAASERKSPNSAPDRNNIDANSHAAEGSRDVSGETAVKGEEGAAETCEAVEPTKDDQKEGQSRSSSAVAESPDDRPARTGAAETVENSEGIKTAQKDAEMDSRKSVSPPVVVKEERAGEEGGSTIG